MLWSLMPSQAAGSEEMVRLGLRLHKVQTRVMIRPRSQQHRPSSLAPMCAAGVSIYCLVLRQVTLYLAARLCPEPNPACALSVRDCDAVTPNVAECTPRRSEQMIHNAELSPSGRRRKLHQASSSVCGQTVASLPFAAGRRLNAELRGSHAKVVAVPRRDTVPPHWQMAGTGIIQAGAHICIMLPTGIWQPMPHTLAEKHSQTLCIEQAAVLMPLLGSFGARSRLVACITHHLQPAAQLANVPHVKGFITGSQISANGRTTSLGDHDTQEAAAAAFDRAAINKDGAAAKTNFDRDNYAAEMTVLASAIGTVPSHLCRPASWHSFARPGSTGAVRAIKSGDHVVPHLVGPTQQCRWIARHLLTAVPAAAQA